MKIIVFGATGAVERHVVKQALEKVFEVTAFVRNGLLFLLFFNPFFFIRCIRFNFFNFFKRLID
ncbi:NmrA family NAD(P)-binding protein [Ureibacillus sp. FSL K6-2830]|uniref:NmrA family NAD(P)-binding protein n=1 Tax=Ureibacillus sp. FSL K6-2830 TaxID=2954610 RepID=UPI0030FA3638